MKLIVTLCISYFSLGFTQETCESLIDILEQTLAQTQSLERTTTIKAGFIEMASVSAVVKRTPSGLEVTEIERSGRELPNGPNNTDEAEAGWLGPFGTDVFSCEGHNLEQLGDGRYDLRLVDKDEATPPQDFQLTLRLENERVVLEKLKSKIKGPGLPITPDMTVTFENWILTGAE